MDKNRNLVGGVFLILLGLVFLAMQLMPDVFGRWIDWPLIVVGVGVLFFLWAILGRTGGLAVPACIIGGIGVLLYWQNATGNWGSWGYVWTLIPGFVGVGILLAGLIDGNLSDNLSGGLILMGISLTAFLIFGSMMGLGWSAARFWPVILIVIGLGILARSLLGRR